MIKYSTATILLTIILLVNNCYSQNLHNGIYVSKKDTIIFNEMTNNYLSYFNLKSGRIGSLTKINDKEYFIGPDNEKPDSLGKNNVGTIKFKESNKEVEFINKKKEISIYKKMAYRERYVSFPVTGGILLKAKLVIPNSSHKIPLIIIGHGSELVSKDFYKEAYLFASWGIATLVYDKRGVDDSTGEKNPDIFIQASDISDAAAYAAKLSEIDSTKIGLWGFSQGGWVAPLALIHQPLLHYSIILSGPGTTAFEEDIAGVRESLKFYGFKNAEQDKATDLVSEIYLTIQDNNNWVNLDVLKNKYKTEKWYPILIKQSQVCSYFLGDQADYVKAHMKELISSNSYTRWCFYNPRRYIERIQCPVLWIYGTEDKSIPVEESMKVLTDIKHNYKNNFEIKLLNKMNHAGYIDEHTGIEDYDHVKFVSPQYLALMKLWLSKEGMIDKR